MKFFLVALLVAVAAAEPEADSDALLYKTPFSPYTSYGAGLYSGVNAYTAGVPVTRYNTAYNTGLYQPSIYNRNIFGYNRYFKRDAEADSDALLYKTVSPYTTHGLYSGLTGYTAGYPTTYSAGYPTTYSTGLYQPSIYNRNIFGYNRYFKREAEAESDPAVVYKQGTFHTNLHNLQKGVHNQYVAPTLGHSLYNTHTPFVQNPVYNTYSAGFYQPTTAYSGYPMYHY